MIMVRAAGVSDKPDGTERAAALISPGCELMAAEHSQRKIRQTG